MKTKTKIKQLTKNTDKHKIIYQH